jgi:MFS family permease
MVAMLRALGETAYYPWTQEFIPNRIRGKYNAVFSALGTISSGAALIIAGLVIGTGNDLSRYMLLLGIGSVLGLIGICAMFGIPGGGPARQPDAPHAHYANMVSALRDSNFVAFMGGMAGITLGSVLLTSFMPLYVKEQIGLASGTVVFLDTASMIGGGLSSLAWGWIADRVGSRPILMPALGLYLVIPLGWLFFPRQTPYAMFLCAALYFTLGCFATGASLGAGRLLFNGVVPQEKNTSYVAIYYAWMGLTGGVAPLLAGAILSAASGWHARLGPLAVDGYSLLFFLSLALLLFGWSQYSRVKPDDVYTTRAAWRLVAARLLKTRSRGADHAKRM